MRSSTYLNGFRGLWTATGRDAPTGYSPAMVNVRTSDGVLRPRYGFRKVADPNTSMTASRGFSRVHGFSATDGEIEEWVAFDAEGTIVRPYSIAADGTRTMLTSGFLLWPEFPDYDWQAFAWDDTAYFTAPTPSGTSGCWRYTIGDVDSLVELPADGVAAPGSAVASGASTDASAVTFLGHVVEAPTFTGTPVTAATREVQGVYVEHLADEIGDCTVDLGFGAAKDWTDYAVLEFIFSVVPGTAFAIDNLMVSMVNDDGSPSVVAADQVLVTVNEASENVYRCSAYWDARDTTLWDNARYLRLSYTILTSDPIAAKNDLDFTFYRIAGIDMYHGRSTNDPLEVGVSYYDTTLDRESDLATASVPAAGFKAKRDGGQPALTRFTEIDLVYQADGTGDKVRFYLKDGNGVWRRLAEETAPIGTVGTYTASIEHADLVDNDPYSKAEFKADQIVGAVAYKGWAVWLYTGGTSNIRHSRIGEPVWHADTENDEVDDANRGATFTMADGASDEPVGAVQAGQALFILGKEGVYAQVGDSPSGMTPTHKLAGSMGCAGRFGFARFRNDAGEPGVAWIDRSGESVWFAAASQAYSADASGKPVELSAAIRGSIKTLFGTTDMSGVRLDVDESTGSLWVVCGQKALVLRPPSVLDDRRQWEYHEYDHPGDAGWSFLAFSPDRKLMAYRATGEMDEVEWDSETGTYIGGTMRDAGLQMPTASYLTAAMVGGRRRLTRVGVEFEEDSDDVQVSSVIPHLTDETHTVGPLARWHRFTTARVGNVHQIEVSLGESVTGIYGLEVETDALSGGYAR